jgi:GNAT superfamily N-acetyltransferase
VIDRIRRVTLDELSDCLVLARDRGWLPEEKKWRLLFEVGTVYGVRDETGELVGTTVLTRFGAELAVISMVLVAARCEGRGLGRRLMTCALAEAGDATVFLYATRHGRPLYERLGFVSVGTSHTHVGRFVAPGGPGASRPAQAADLAAILRLDAEVNGADRARLMERLPGFVEQVRVVDRRGAVSGFAGAWRSVDYLVIGPVYAETVDDAKLLIGDLAGAIDGPVRLDLDGRYPRLREWVTGHGVPLRNSTTVMVHGGRPLPGDRDRSFVPVMYGVG